MNGRVVYLDYAATTPVDPRVAARMAECLTADGVFGNPSSSHAPGRAARARVEAARAEVAAAIGARPTEIVFTSGATEADNLAVLGAVSAAGPRCHVVTLKTEHRAVLDAARALERAGHRVTWLVPAVDGRLAPEALAAALTPETALVSVMAVNNETGVIQDLAALAAVTHAKGALFHADCAQAVGKLVIDVGALGVDLASFSAHKAYGPKGIGALYVREGVRLEAVTHGGGQEHGLRSGTLATHQIVGMGAAFALAAASLDADRARLAALRARLRERLLALGDAHENGAAAHAVPHILSVSFGGVHGESLAAGLTGIAVSTGSACNAAHSEPSHVLRAMGRSPELAGATLRFSLGRPTTADEVEAAADEVETVLVRLRALAPAASAGA